MCVCVCVGGGGHFLEALSDLSSREVEQDTHTHTHTHRHTHESQNPIMAVEVAAGKGYSSLLLSLLLSPLCLSASNTR